MPIHTRVIPLVPLVLLLGGAAVPSLAQGTVYSQPPVFTSTSTTGFSSWTSSTSSSFVTSDNFTLANSDSLTGITWQGFTFIANGGGQGAEPATFNIEFRADNGGIPGTVLDNELVTPAKTLAGTTDFFGTGKQNSIYNYTASLSSVFNAPANTPLWVSVIGDTTSSNFWTWTQGTGGNNASYQEITGGGSTTRSGDRAFSLSGAPVPEDSTTVSLGLPLMLGLGGVLAARRKRAIR